MHIRKITAKHLIIIIAVIAFVACGVWYLLHFSSSPQSYLPKPAYKPITEPAATPEPSPIPATITVHITGHVNYPGVFELPKGSRVSDAVEAAGGLSEEGDDRSINKADWLVDGQQIIVNNQPQPISPVTSGDVASALININTASSSELQRLHGVGEVTAGNIIAHRERHGPFLSIDQIMNVSGIGLATFERLQDHITVN